eukprot:12258222-Alexandrium_andersonii.AAC.1
MAEPDHLRRPGDAEGRLRRSGEDWADWAMDSRGERGQGGEVEGGLGKCSGVFVGSPGVSR